jgi:mutator protein MutT
MIHQVAVGALVRGGRVLMVHRRPDLKNAPDRWSFPGGHLEPRETAGEALTRELREELGIGVVVTEDPDLYVVDEINEVNRLEISLWVIPQWRGVPENAAPDENDAVKWVDARDLSRLRLAHWTCRDIILKYAPGPARTQGVTP